jgi:hypothetical protein
MSFYHKNWTWNAKNTFKIKHINIQSLAFHNNALWLKKYMGLAYFHQMSLFSKGSSGPSYLRTLQNPDSAWGAPPPMYASNFLLNPVFFGSSHMRSNACLGLVTSKTHQSTKQNGTVQQPSRQVNLTIYSIRRIITWMSTETAEWSGFRYSRGGAGWEANSPERRTPSLQAHLMRKESQFTVLQDTRLTLNSLLKRWLIKFCICSGSLVTLLGKYMINWSPGAFKLVQHIHSGRQA